MCKYKIVYQFEASCLRYTHASVKNWCYQQIVFMYGKIINEEERLNVFAPSLSCHATCIHLHQAFLESVRMDDLPSASKWLAAGGDVDFQDEVRDLLPFKVCDYVMFLYFR